MQSTDSMRLSIDISRMMGDDVRIKDDDGMVHTVVQSLPFPLLKDFSGKSARIVVCYEEDDWLARVSGRFMDEYLACVRVCETKRFDSGYRASILAIVHQIGRFWKHQIQITVLAPFYFPYVFAVTRRYPHISVRDVLV